MAGTIRWLGAICAACLCAHAWAEPSWKLTRTDHFELYSEAGDDVTRPLLVWFEQLRAFFEEQPLVKVGALPPVRLIVFASENAYEPYRLRATSDAYYTGGTAGHYIAMYAGKAEFRIAAHEFAHFALNASGLRLPPWLNEGLAELFSTLRVSENACELGGDLPVHSSILRRRTWMPLAELLAMPAESPVRQDRQGAALFYAETWALAEMLALSPEYGGRLPQLFVAAADGRTGAEALQAVYGKSPDAIEGDLRAWVQHGAAKPIRLPGVAAQPSAVQVSDVDGFAAQSILADLLVMSGELDRAAALYRDLARQRPGSADVSAALGAIALRKGDAAGAREFWKRAIDQGVTDAQLCFRYAILADNAGLMSDQIRPALERAVTLRPEFDDARYKLALLEKNTGHWEAALAQFQAMRNIAPARAFSYWSAVADTLNQLGKRDEAVAAARQAAKHAASAQERQRANELAYFAQTDMAVQFERDSNGREHMVTTRVPHQTSDWNPFVEPGDELRRVRGALREIECGHGGTRIRVETAHAMLTLAIVDPSRVQMRNAPDELVCGAQSGDTVLVDYAASKRTADVDGVVRGIDFAGAK
jgi:tetratricopeptide (TPR) repeat protein